jgi:propanol-preferring alcohol dehydrogenase
VVDGMAVTEQKTRGRLGLFGFGAAAHLCVQIAAHRGWEVYVFTRGEEHRRLALELGATWAGASGQRPGAGSGRGETVLGAAVVFAPVGDLAVEALKVVDRGGIVALGGIHSTPIPSFDYQLIYGERVLRSVTNSTRLDAIELLRTAAAIPVRTEVERFPLEKANDALRAVKESRVRGAAVLQIA